MKLIDISTLNRPDIYCKVSDEDFEWLNKWKWFAFKAPAHNTFYAVRNSSRKAGKRRLIYMHREIMQTESGMATDHVDGDGLNNTRINLRTCTIQQNNFNSQKRKNCKYSKYIGVSWNEETKKFTARVKVSGKTISLGYFKTQEEAAIARDAGAALYHGEFAKLNGVI